MSGNITVAGTGSVHVVPDVTRIDVAINRWFATYEEAYACGRENSLWMVKILEYNKKSGQLAKTIDFDISVHVKNVYDTNGNYVDEEADGFDLEQHIRLSIGIDNVLLNNIVRGIGKFIKNAQINIGYTVQDSRPFQLKMLAKAVKDAQEKAEIMASTVGKEIEDVESITYDKKVVSVYSQARNIHSNQEAMACCKESLDITPDDLVVSDEVTVVWKLK